MKTIAAAVGFLLEKLSKEGCSCTLSASLLLLMASGSSDLLNSSLESNLISRFPGNFNRSIPFFFPVFAPLVFILSQTWHKRKFMQA